MPSGSKSDKNISSKVLSQAQVMHHKNVVSERGISLAGTLATACCSHTTCTAAVQGHYSPETGTAQVPVP